MRVRCVPVRSLARSAGEPDAPLSGLVQVSAARGSGERRRASRLPPGGLPFRGSPFLVSSSSVSVPGVFLPGSRTRGTHPPPASPSRVSLLGLRHRGLPPGVLPPRSLSPPFPRVSPLPDFLTCFSSLVAGAALGVSLPSLPRPHADRASRFESRSPFLLLRGAWRKTASKDRGPGSGSGGL